MDPTVQQILDAVASKNYALATVLALIALVFAIRKIAPRLHGGVGKFFNSDRGGSTLVLVTSMLGVLSTALATGKHLSFALVLGAVMTAATASGGWNLAWDLFSPEDRKPPHVPAPAVAPVPPPAEPPTTPPAA